MGKLTSLFKQEIAKDKDKTLGSEARTLYAFPTGLDVFDYKNGKIINVQDDEPYYSIGIDEGTYVMIVGPSGTGKTTLAIQMAAKIVESYEESQIIHDDIEAATNSARIEALTGWDRATIKEKYIHKDTGITSESFYKRIKMLADIKLKNREELLIDTGVKDSNGEYIKILPPTVFILDSIALLAPKDVGDEEELSGQMSATSIARVNTSIFKRILPKLRAANIILFAINHLTTKIEINPMVHTKADVNYLKQNEAIPGGKAITYLANNILKLEAGAKLVKNEGYGVEGFMVKGTLIKSRSNKAGQTFDLVYSQDRGYNNILSNFNMLKEVDKVKGAGKGYYLEECPDIKFTQKEFPKKLKASKELKKAFKILSKKVLKTFVPILKDEEDEIIEEETVEQEVSMKKKKKKK